MHVFRSRLHYVPLLVTNRTPSYSVLLAFVHCETQLPLFALHSLFGTLCHGNSGDTYFTGAFVAIAYLAK